jgi:hypothetical protein
LSGSRPPSSGLSLPANCIVGHSASNQAKAFVVRDGLIHPVNINVTVGDDGTTTEILAGLGPDDSVVLNPRSVNEEGTPVVSNPIPSGDLPH